MPQVVEHPVLGELEFKDDATDADIAETVDFLLQQQRRAQGPSGRVQEGVGQPIPGDIRSRASRESRLRQAEIEGRERLALQESAPPTTTIQARDPQTSTRTLSSIFQERFGREKRPILPDIREKVQGVLPESQFARVPISAAPSIVGATVGGALGGPPGAAIGGFITESAAQALGIAPESDIAKALSALGPTLGIGTTKAFQLIGRGLSGTAFFRAAFGRLKTEQYIRAAEVTTNKLAPNIPAGNLYQRVDRMGVKLFPSAMKNTRAALKALRKEIERLGIGLEKKQTILAEIDGFEAKLAPKGFQPPRPAGFAREQPGFQKPGPIDFATMQANRRAIGTEIARFENQVLGGTKLGQSKFLFAAIESDLDRIVAKSGMPKVAVKLLRKANKTNQRERSIDELNAIWSKTTKEGPEGFPVFDPKGAANAIKGLIDPKSPSFNKNFAASLGDESKDILAWLRQAQAELKRFGSAGPGELQVRQRFSKLGAAVGSTVGGIFFGAPGATIGAFIGSIKGVKGPEFLTKALLTPLGRKILMKHLKATEGRLSTRAVAVAAFLGQSGIQMTEKGITVVVNEIIKPSLVKFIEGGKEAVRQIDQEARRGQSP